jgi:hypothetical protein
MSPEETLSALAIRHVEESLRLQELLQMEVDQTTGDEINSAIQEQKALVDDLYEQIKALTITIENPPQADETTQTD